MALADILEALTAGGSAGLSAYAREKELEQERAERERARQEEARYRQQMLDASLRAEEREEAAIERQRVQDIERGMSEGRLREVRDIYNPAAVRQSVAGLEQEIGGVGEAPEQTYAARMMRQQEERPKSPLASALREEEPEVALEGMGRVSEELPSRLSFLSEVPEFEATESFRERGSQQYGDTAVRPVTPEEKAASEREMFEQDLAESQGRLERAMAGDEQAISEMYARGEGDRLEKMMEFLTPEAPEAPDLPATAQLIEYLRAMYPDMPEEELLQRAGAGLPAGPDAGAGQGLSPSQLNQIRSRFSADIADASEVASAFRRIRASSENALTEASDPESVGTPASQISLIFSFMKMLDPGSVVREGEYATARKASGVPDRIRNLYNRALNGDFLTPVQVQDFVNQAELIAKEERASAREIINRNSEFISSIGGDPTYIVYDPFDSVLGIFEDEPAAGPSGGAIDDVDEIINDIFPPLTTRPPLLPQIGSSDYFDNLMAPR